MRALPILLASALAVTFLPGIALAHGGGLDSAGCHNNRKTGDYHCHRSPAALQPAPERNSFTPSPVPRDSGAFRDCSEARAAGAAPVRRGQPGYGPHLDRDNDGIGCE